MDEIRLRLDARTREKRAAGKGRRSAVLVPLFAREEALWVLFTLRTNTVEHHRGQISFPGGAEEERDGTLVATALRETEEEIGIAPEDVRLLGALSPLTTLTDFYVEPFVGAIPHPYAFRPAEAEIAELIEVPVAALASPDAVERRLLPGRPEPTLFYHYGSHVIWGATARILGELLDVLK